jgi:hypothetical protein
MEMLGSKAIWKLPKSAFLCSRKVPAAQVLKCYDWAIAMRDAGKCVMLGAHSQLEKDVLHYLLKGSQPVVLVLARTMLARINGHLQDELDNGRLLVVVPPAIRSARVSARTAALRNSFMIERAQEVVTGHVHPGGQLEKAFLAAQVSPKVL